MRDMSTNITPQRHRKSNIRYPRKFKIRDTSSQQKLLTATKGLGSVIFGGTNQMKQILNNLTIKCNIKFIHWSMVLTAIFYVTYINIWLTSTIVFDVTLYWHSNTFITNRKNECSRCVSCAGANRRLESIVVTL